MIVGHWFALVRSASTATMLSHWGSLQWESVCSSETMDPASALKEARLMDSRIEASLELLLAMVSQEVVAYHLSAT